MAGAVAIPIEWFIGTITGLAGIIGVLARTIFKLQEDRRAFDLASQQKTLEVIQASTAAQLKLSETIGALGQAIAGSTDRDRA